MAFCANCGSDVQGKFCAKCGAPSGVASGSAGTAGPPPPQASYAPASTASAGIEENVAAALCYLLTVLTGVLFLVIEPYSRNRVIRFHAFQSIFVWLAAVVVGIVLSVVSYVFVSIPFIGWLIYIVLWTAFSLGILVLWLFLMYKAYNRERFVVPVVGQWAEKQAQS